MSDLTVFVNSTDAYRDCWVPFFTLLHRYWPDCRHEIVLNTDREEFVVPHLPVQSTCVGRSADRTLTWSECTAIALSRIDTPFVLYMQEDYFIDGPVQSTVIDSLVDRMTAEAIDCVQLYPSTRTAPWVGGDEELKIVRKRAPYWVNLQAAIWSTSALASVLRRHESPWQLEYWGSRRRAASRLDIRAYAPERDARVVPYERTGVVEGRWKRELVVPLFQREGIDVDFSTRGFVEDADASSVRSPLLVRAWSALRSL